jgi:hypothetical protein
VRVSGALISFDLMINRIVQELQKLDATFLDATSLIFRFLGEKIQSKAAGMEGGRIRRHLSFDGEKELLTVSSKIKHYFI